MTQKIKPTPEVRIAISLMSQAFGYGLMSAGISLETRERIIKDTLEGVEKHLDEDEQCLVSDNITPTVKGKDNEQPARKTVKRGNRKTGQKGVSRKPRRAGGKDRGKGKSS